jgi:DNA-binding NarL/FixJ family response regulator
MAPSSGRPAIRVMIASSSPVLRTGLASFLEGHKDMRVVAVADATDQHRDVETDVAVFGLTGLGLDETTQSVARIRAGSDTKVVAVVGDVEDALGWVMAAGVNACLNMWTTDTDALTDAVRAVMAGQTIISKDLLTDLREQERAKAPAWTLTPRERDVLALLAKGQSNKSIARLLEVQVGTIRGHVSMILAKLGVTNRTEAATVTLQQGLLSRDTHPAPADDEIAPASHLQVGVPPG